MSDRLQVTHAEPRRDHVRYPRLCPRRELAGFWHVHHVRLLDGVRIGCVVRGGLNVPEDPFKRELRKWVFGSDDFPRPMVAMAEGSDRTRHQSTSRRLKAVSVDEILNAVSSHHDVEAESYARFRSQAPGRDIAAWLYRKWTGATLRELGPYFGLSGVDSVSNLVRRAEKSSLGHESGCEQQRKLNQVYA